MTTLPLFWLSGKITKGSYNTSYPKFK